MAKGFFVTGTDTGIGKTVVSGALVRFIQGQGLATCGMKPVETGCRLDGDRLFPADATFLRDVSKCDERLEDIVPYCFETPLAPMVASEIERRAIDPVWLVRAFQKLADKYDAVVVEGVGGILVPITGGYSVVDFARDLSLPVVVVASPFLGTINHTLLTVEHALNEGLRVAGVILNYHRPPERTVAEATNPGVVEKLCPVPFIGTMPYLEEIDGEALQKAFSDNLATEVLRGYL